MGDKNKRKRIRKILAVLIALTLVFIWGHSLMDREDSANESSLVRALIEPFLELFVGKGNVTDHMVRKLAHFCEYALLGAELMCYFYVSACISETCKKTGSCLFHTALLAEAHVMFTAMTDETVQIFSGRGSQLQDVWLDNAGGAAGIFFVFVIFRLLVKKHRIIKNSER